MSRNFEKINLIERAARFLRIETLKMTSEGGSSHIGSIFSICDIIAVLYCDILNITPNTIDSPDRDRFILSKGHAGASVYAALAYKGFIDREMLSTHYQNYSKLSGHVSHLEIPGVEFSTGSLGHGFPVAAGIALSAKLSNRNYKTYVLLSDGECDEGSNWEAALFSAHHDLVNLTVIIDYNKMQSITSTEDTLGLEPFQLKWESFGFNVFNIDGHSVLELLNAFNADSTDKPKCIIANTVKGKGVSFMENNILWHYRSAQDSEFDLAMQELSF